METFLLTGIHPRFNRGEQELLHSRLVKVRFSFFCALASWKLTLFSFVGANQAVNFIVALTAPAFLSKTSFGESDSPFLLV